MGLFREGNANALLEALEEVMRLKIWSHVLPSNQTRAGTSHPFTVELDDKMIRGRFHAQ
jgi:hypothetical protein